MLTVPAQKLLKFILQMAVYADFSAALNDISAAKEVFQERDEQERS